MRIVLTVAAMQKLARRWKQAGRRIGLVPTMGYLHAGHLSLVRCARQAVGKRGRVVVSIYVNPTQFGPGEDFTKYPRDLKRDLSLCRAAGVDVLFLPNDREMYPVRTRSRGCKSADEPRSDKRGYGTCVVEDQLSQTMEGASRPAHFRGVTTVVAKLFHLVLPDVAAFGRKDFQQAAVIRRMVADLNFPVKIIVAPTVREADGLAMSSRNQYLTGDLRRQATVLWCAIQMARATAKKSRTFPAMKLKAAVKKLVECEPDAKLDYVEFFEPKTLVPVARVTRGVQMALAVFIGETRLIDNARI
ncbi:MAG TPA: pantoate--beta-alanine ligase [Candidatus Sulfopaludibacter sp.]|nr:pantoate--beta-alanine ligase [Candidatus Sulfopaludibacter sp.]